VVIGETAEIGDDCTIYQGVTLGGTSLTRGAKRHPTLERGVIVGAGAQVLGGFTVGEYAKVGSNAVLVKPVPPGATAVGNPAHIIEKSTRLQEASSAHLFAAYGVTPNADDPVTKALHGLLERCWRRKPSRSRRWPPPSRTPVLLVRSCPTLINSTQNNSTSWSAERRAGAPGYGMAEICSKAINSTRLRVLAVLAEKNSSRPTTIRCRSTR
jgi:hypothetical protein